LHNTRRVLWVNLGLISLTLALLVGLAVVWRPQIAPLGRVVMTLALQVSGIFVVTWLLVERGQALSVRLPPPAAFEASLVAQVSSAALASLELVLVSIVLGTCVGTALAAIAAWARQPWLELVLGVGSLVWVIPTFLLAIFAQDLQSAIYGLSGVNVSGSFGTATPTQVIWSSAVLAVRPAAYAFRQSRVLIADQSRADFVRTALAKGVDWRSVVIRHIVRPAAAGLVQTAANSVRLMVGSLPLVEFFFAYPGVGRLLLASLGVSYGAQAPQADPALAIGSAVALAGMLAIVEAVTRLLGQRLDPRLAEASV
jgi:ABC-type dipeptide/oligopeptide/nickel transport system permease component